MRELIEEYGQLGIAVIAGILIIGLLMAIFAFNDVSFAKIFTTVFNQMR